MSSRQFSDFRPAGAIPLRDALVKMGEALCPDWDGDAFGILLEVFASTPKRWSTLPLTEKRWPDRKAMPPALEDLITAVWASPGGADQASYKAAVAAAATRWPDARRPAKQHADQVLAHLRQWIGDGKLRVFWVPEGGNPEPFPDALARKAITTELGRMFLTGKGPDDGPALVDAAQLDGLIAEVRRSPEPPLRPVSQKELRTRHANFRIRWVKATGYAPSRDDTRKWGRDTFGDSVTQSRLDALAREGNTAQRKRGGRPPLRKPARKSGARS